MISLVTVRSLPLGESQSATGDRETQGRMSCQQLEEGNILFFPKTPFNLTDNAREFLLSQRQSGSEYHKNIAFRPNQDLLTGIAKRSAQEKRRLHEIMRAYCAEVTEVVSKLLPQYAKKWRPDYASFRPQEERDRRLRLRARNDLLHIDSFPTRPTNGDRILRIFTNINPTEPRIWLTSETFDGLAHRFLGSAGQPLPLARTLSRRYWLDKFLIRFTRVVGSPKSARSRYDHFMLRFHHYLKENREFQETCPKQRWEFPPSSSWIVFTDMVSHSVLAGQFALENTFIVSRDTLLLPHKAPVSILESLCGSSFTNSQEEL